MRKTTLDFLVGSGVGVGTVQPRGARMHPRRDEGGHPTGTKVEKTDPPAGETAEEKAAREKAEADAAAAKKTGGKSDAEKAAEASAKAEKKRADDLEAELEAERNKNRTEDEKKAAETVKAKVKEAVDAKVVELTDHYEGIISDLRTEIIDGLISTALAETGRSAEDFKVVLATLDKATFLDENGVVKKADVSKWASELAGSASRRPPRTGGSRATSTNRGMGQWASEKS
ncbi:scaffolding protein [Rhodococcus phage GuyFagieri]|nr:scaffolding protein [Rhodococcus phage GuyFagieri]